MDIVILKDLFEKAMNSQDGQFSPGIVDDAKALLNEALESETPEARLFDVMQSNRRGKNRKIDACAARIITEYFVDYRRAVIEAQGRQPA